MSMISIRLNSGRTVFVEALYCQLTYQSLVMGHARKELNAEIVQGLLARVNQLWPDVPVRFVNMSDDDILPKYFVAASAFSMQPARDKTRDASQLVIAWFSSKLPLAEDFSTEVPMKSLCWEEYAYDYEC